MMVLVGRFRMRSSGLSHTGMARKHNEDCFEIDPERRLYVVADGMGGHSHGEIASRIAVDAIRDYVTSDDPDAHHQRFKSDGNLTAHSNLLRNAVRIAHKNVLQAILRDRSLQGMGTTVVGLLVDDSVAALAHVGDSRAYRYRAGKLELMTQDHTWVNEQVVAGYLSAEQARVHPLKNVVTRALGSEREVNVDLREIEIAAGDLYLICSDGLTTMLRDDEIEAFIAAPGASLDEICQRLIDAANGRGGLDNVTVILVAVDQIDGSSP